MTTAPVYVTLPLDHRRPAASSYFRERCALSLDSGSVDNDQIIAGMLALLSREVREEEVALGIVTADGLRLARAVIGQEACARSVMATSAQLSDAATGVALPVLIVSDMSCLKLAARPLAASELALIIDRRSDGLRLEFDYDAELFEAATCERLLARLVRLLRAMATEPQRALSTIALVDDAERTKLLGAWNNTYARYDGPMVLHHHIEAQCRATPNATALIFEGSSLSYAELDARAEALGGKLRALGVGRDSMVVVALERSLDMMVALLATLKAGGAYLPLDPEYPRQRASFMLDDAAAPVVLTQSFLRESLPPHAGETLCVDEFTPAAHDDAPGDVQTRATQPCDLAYVIYTSGSTGKPKGALIEHRSIVNRLLWMQDTYELMAGDRVLQKTPISFDVSVWELFWPLMAGATLVLAKPGGHKDPSYLASTIIEQGVTVMHFVPSMLHVFLEDEAAGKCTSLRQVFCSGEALSLDLAARFFELLPAKLDNLYGPTEAAVDVTRYRCEAFEDRASVPIGRPIANTQTYILDALLEPVAVGAIGELYLGGVQLARGYHRRPELTQDRFIRSPFAADARLYKTGDLARYLDDGQIEFLGRLDDQVKVRGFRIELGEIQAQLEAHALVQQAVVLLRDDATLVAYVVLPPDAVAHSVLLELRRSLLAALPDYMVPSFIVPLATLPLTPNGKLDRRALPAPSAQSHDDYRAPETAAQRRLAAIWSEVLGVERVGIADNYFELGGDSIRSIQIRALAQKAEIYFGLDALLMHPTIESLATAASMSSAAPAAASEAQLAPFALLSPGDRSALAKRFEAQPLEDAYPLTALQGGMLFHSELTPESAVYHDIFNYLVEAQFDTKRLREAARAMVARHSVLRSAFDLHAFDEPLMLVHGAADMPLEVEDLRDLSPAEQQQSLAAWVRRERSRAFDWQKPPLLRMHVHRTTEGRFWLSLSFHHAILDGWSVASLLTELLTRYGGAVSSDAPTAQFCDYVVLERQALGQPEHAAFWDTHLEGAPFTALPRVPRALRLPTADFDEGRLEIALPSEVARAVEPTARMLGVATKSLLLSVHLVALRALCNQDDIVTGLITNGRPEQEGAERMLGLFLNACPLRVRLETGSFRELIAQVVQLEAALLRHRRFPMAEVKRRRGGAALFETAFNYVHFHVVEALDEVDGVRLLERRYFEQTDFALTTNFVVDAPGAPLRLSLMYDSAELDVEQVRAFGGYYARALAALVANVDAQHEKLCLLPPSERELLRASNDTTVPYAKNGSIHGCFEAQAERTPEHAALSFGAESLSYRQLNDRANLLARQLGAKGVEPGDFVGICLERSLSTVIAMLAILKTGAAYVPLDPGYPSERLAMMLDDCGLRNLVTSSELATRFHEHSAAEGSAVEGPAPALLLIDKVTAVPPTEQGWQSHQSAADTPAYVMYTSGSTGKPKGVVVPHRGVLRLVLNTEFTPHGDSRVWLQLAPISFDASTLEIWSPLLHGGRCAVYEHRGAPEIAELRATLEREGVTSLWLTASLFNLIIDEAPETLKSVQEVLTGGEALSVAHVQRAQEALPNTQLTNGYGPTESTTFACAYRIPRPLDPGLSAIPIGRPIKNTRIAILDARGGPVPIGTSGELYIGGDGLALRYHARPQLTAERFVEVDGQRMYRTGDQARYLRDGRIDFLGRTDNQVKLRGFRIELGEIEAQIAAHADVREVVVVVRTSAQAEQSLVAYVVGDNLDSAALAEQLRARLPAYMVPAVFVPLEAMPLTPNGKIDRPALPAPQASLQALHVAPESATEHKLAAIWSAVLGVEKIGSDDAFFDLGGHSLSATRMVLRAREAFSVPLEIRQVFERPSLAALASHIDTLSADLRSDPLKPVARDEPPRASFAQQRLWYIDRLTPGTAAYNIPSAHRLVGALDVVALTQALQGLVDRHESLRTTFGVMGGSPVQTIAPELKLQLPLVDVSECPGELSSRLADAAREPFTLADGPLIRTQLFRLADTEHVLFLMTHHTISDGWSQVILMRDLASLYAGEALAPLAVQYADFATWQRRRLDDAALAPELKYWLDTLAEELPVLTLPTRGARPAMQSFDGKSTRRQLPADLIKRLKLVARQNDATLFMLLLSAFGILLKRYSGQSDIIVGSPVDGRTHPDAEPLVGFFVNTLPLRLDLAGSPTFKQLLAQVRGRCLAAYDHQELPFERLVEELSPKRDPARTPVFQAIFAYQAQREEAYSLGQLSMAPLPIDSGVARTDVTLYADERDDGVHATLEYATALFDDDMMDGLLTHYAQLLESIAARPDAAISELSLLAPAEEQELLRATDRSGAAPKRARSIHRLFEEHAAYQPDVIAVVHGAEQLSYGELERRANILARRLVALGVKRDVPVALCLARSTALAIGVMATLKAGGAFLPIDPGYPDERIQLLIKDAAAPVFIAEESLEVACQNAIRLTVHAEGDAVADGVTPPALDHDDPSSLAYIVYTSGSTGIPKGVCVEHRAAHALLAGFERAAPSGSPLVSTALCPVGFDVSIWELLSTWCYGGTLHMLPERSLTPRKLAAYAVENGVTSMYVPPALLSRFIEYLQPAHGALKRVLVGVEPIPLSLLQRLAQRGICVVNGYGPTETTVCATLHVVEGGIDGVNDGDRRTPIGKPVDGYRIYLVDDALQLVPRGVAGEILVGGAGLARGYLKRPEDTARRFIADPFSAEAEARVYRTGDRGRLLPSGDIEFIDRVDHQVKVRGFRVEPGEIEAALGEHASVERAVVLVREDTPGDKRIVAYALVRTGTTITASDARRHLRRKLPEHMIPQHVVALDRLPLTSHGKVDRAALPAPAAAQAPRQAPLNTPAEKLLGRLWVKALGLQSVGATDNFFDLGGHSLKLIEVTAQLYEDTGVELNLRSFVLGTLKQVAAELEPHLAKTQPERKTATAPPTTPHKTPRPILGRLFTAVKKRFR